MPIQIQFGLMTALFASLLFASTAISAEPKITQVDSDELARETVFPVFDNPQVVLNRKVPVDGRFELGLQAGLTLLEALYQNWNGNLLLQYHLSEDHAVGATYTILPTDLSATGEDLAQGKGLADGEKFDASLAPAPESFWLATYEFTAYYGKISLAKNTVANLSLFATAGAGQVQFTDSSSFALSVGLGQRFYITPNWALRFDLRFLRYEGPDPTSQDLNPDTVPERLPSSSFSDAEYWQSTLQIGAVFLL